MSWTQKARVQKLPTFKWERERLSKRETEKRVKNKKCVVNFQLTPTQDTNEEKNGNVWSRNKNLSKWAWAKV